MSLVVPRHLACRELVELVTAYLEGALDEEDRSRFEEHLVYCNACVTYVDQIRQTIRIAGAIGEEDLDPRVEHALLHAFRAFHRKEEG